MIRYLSLALCKAHDPDAEILPGIVAGPLDLWPVPQIYDARVDGFVGSYCPEHAWPEVDVQIAPGVSSETAAAYLRRVAAWLDAHGEELLAHPRVVEELGSGASSDQRREDAPHEHLRARDRLRIAIEKRLPTRKPKP